MTFNEFKQNWLGKRVADPLLAGDHPYQCASFVKQGLKEIDGLDTSSSWWGNAIDYWRKTNPAMLAHRRRLPTQVVQEGDVVILKTAGYTGDPELDPGEGHIGFATGGDTGPQFELLEQNGATGNGLGEGGDVIRTRWINKSRIAGVLRFIPVPAPQTPPIPASYQIVESYSPGKQVKLNNKEGSKTNLWGMNYHFDYMKDHPIEVHDNGEIITVTNKVHHEDGYDYYRRDGQVDGFNVLDCDDYTPPAPAPYVPPAAPVKAKPAETYVLDWEVPTFENPNDAVFSKNAKGTLKPGSYIVFDRNDQAINLTENNHAPGVWININHNAPPLPPEPKPTTPPLPAPLQNAIQGAGRQLQPILVPATVKEANMATDWQQCTPLKVDHAGRWIAQPYVSTNSVVKNIRSLDGKLPATIPLPPNRKLMIVSTFIGPDGKTYARDDILTESHRFYALDFENDLKPYVHPRIQPTLDVNHDGDVDIHDYLDLTFKYLKPGIDVVARTAKVLTTAKPKRFINDIVAAKKKDRS